MRVNLRSVGFEYGEVSSDVQASGDRNPFMHGCYFSLNTIHNPLGSVSKRPGTEDVMPGF